MFLSARHLWKSLTSRYFGGNAPTTGSAARTTMAVIGNSKVPTMPHSFVKFLPMLKPFLELETTQISIPATVLAAAGRGRVIVLSVIRRQEVEALAGRHLMAAILIPSRVPLAAVSAMITHNRSTRHQNHQNRHQGVAVARLAPARKSDAVESAPACNRFNDSRPDCTVTRKTRSLSH